jgi:lauroyl/myristoyl acyltransferase
VILPNRKFVTTELIATDVELVEGGQERDLVRANALFVWSYYARLARVMNRGSRERAYEQITVIGEKNLHSAAAGHRGIILLSVHLGDFDLGGGWLAERCAITPVVCNRALRPRWRNALFSIVRRRIGVLMREVGSTGINVLENDLHQGRALLVMLDRRPHGLGSASRIFDRPALASGAVGLLAARTGAPLMAAATWRGSDGQMIVWFGEPFTASGPDQAMAHISEAGDQLGQIVRTHPEQWHVPADVGELAWSPNLGTSQPTSHKLEPRSSGGTSQNGLPDRSPSPTRRAERAPPA